MAHDKLYSLLLLQMDLNSIDLISAHFCVVVLCLELQHIEEMMTNSDNSNYSVTYLPNVGVGSWSSPCSSSWSCSRSSTSSSLFWATIPFPGLALTTRQRTTSDNRCRHSAAVQQR